MFVRYWDVFHLCSLREDARRGVAVRYGLLQCGAGKRYVAEIIDYFSRHHGSEHNLDPVHFFFLRSQVMGETINRLALFPYLSRSDRQLTPTLRQS